MELCGGGKTNSFCLLSSFPLPLLQDFLYQAIFVPEGAEMPDRSILQLPELRHYTEYFGQKAGDLAFVAEDEGQVVGAAWVRHIHDYGYV